MKKMFFIAILSLLTVGAIASNGSITKNQFETSITSEKKGGLFSPSSLKMSINLTFVLPCGITVSGTWNVPGSNISEWASAVGALGVSLQYHYCPEPQDPNLYA